MVSGLDIYSSVHILSTRPGLRAEGGGWGMWPANTGFQPASGPLPEWVPSHPTGRTSLFVPREESKAAPASPVFGEDRKPFAMFCLS